MYDILKIVENDFRHFNAGALRDAAIGYVSHIKNGGKMFVAMAGAMSSAELGVSLAPMIKNEKIHGISVTGANLEESIFRLIGNDNYSDVYNYRYFQKDDDASLLANGYRRITDMVFSEDKVVNKVRAFLYKEWKEAQENGERYFPHEYFYKVLNNPAFKKLYTGNPDECWMLEACQKNLPIVVPGWEDSTIGNLFSGYCKKGIFDPCIMKNGIEYMMSFYDIYKVLSQNDAGVGFFQIGGGISGDFPICVVPSIKLDLEEDAKPWAYFCQISDSVTSYGSYSGATPNEKITWDKLTSKTPMYVIESDATIVFPLIAHYVLEQK